MTAAARGSSGCELSDRLTRFDCSTITARQSSWRRAGHPRPRALGPQLQEPPVQVPARFEYERATSVEHALELLARRGPGARLLAGGHRLLPMMKLRLATPQGLVGHDGPA